MTKISKILCVVDPDHPAQAAVARAAWLATATGAALELLVVYYNEYVLGHPLFEQDLLEKARDEAMAAIREKLEAQAAGIASKHGIDVSATVTWDHPLHEGIVRHAIATGADLVVKETQQQSGHKPRFLSNEDWNLIRTCPGLLWIVRRDDMPKRVRLIAAVDPLHQHDKPAALDEAILKAGGAIAGATGSELHAFHAFDPRIAMSTASYNVYIPVSLPIADIEAQMREQHGARFSEVLEGYDIPEERRHLVTGLPDEALPRLASELDATAVVMGAVARNRIKRLFIGSTAERTLNRLPCDLVIVKPDWFAPPVAVESPVAAAAEAD
ncbi:MAG: universal stress protein [Woeseiaceae bacterium]|nr:universal stress protein [Woeseiaceae bacterium]